MNRKTDDYRTDPLEYVMNVRTGVLTVELRGAIDREARKAASK